MCQWGNSFIRAQGFVFPVAYVLLFAGTNSTTHYCGLYNSLLWVI